MLCRNPGLRAPVVQQINDHLERLLGKEGFGLIERSNHIAILPLEGTVQLVPDSLAIMIMITADLWTWFDREGGRAIASERHFGKKGVY